MKRVTGILSMLVVASLALAACATPENTNGNIIEETPMAGEATLGVDGTGETVEPGFGDGTEGEATVAPDMTVEPGDTLEETVDPGFGTGQMETQTVEGTPAAGATADMTPQATEAMTGATDPSRASNLVGEEIEDSNGEFLGEVDSLVVERSSGRIAYVLIDVEDDINDGEGLVALPWNAINAVDEPGEGNDEFVFSLDQEQLATAPTLVVDDDADLLPGWDQEVAQHWGTQVAVVPDTGAGDGTSGVVRLDDVTGLNLEDANGEDIGEVEDMIVDLQQGAVQYVIWAAGGFLGIGEDWIPVPFTHLTWGNEDNPNALTLNVTEDQLQNAPTFGDDGIPDVAEPGWDDEFVEFWNSITPNLDVQ